MRPRVNRWLDLLDRVGWTLVYGIAAGLFVVLTEDGFGWETGAKFVAVQGVLAVLKVVIGQRTGEDDTGSLIGTSVVEPPPQAPSS